MKYELLWSSAERRAGEVIEISQDVLDRTFVQSGQHIGTMTDILTEKLKIMRGDAARIVEEFWFED